MQMFIKEYWYKALKNQMILHLITCLWFSDYSKFLLKLSCYKSAKIQFSLLVLTTYFRLVFSFTFW